jgi:hypothetical protein
MTIAAIDKGSQGGSMTTGDTGRLSGGKVDFTLMSVAHRAFERDLQRLATAVADRRASDLAVWAGWDTFRNQLHIHHHAEDRSLWPALGRKTTCPDDVAVVDLMEAEHASIDRLLSWVDTSSPPVTKPPSTQASGHRPPRSPPTSSTRRTRPCRSLSPSSVRSGGPRSGARQERPRA